MSASAINKTSSSNTQYRMKDGEEPTELLLALVSSPLMTLLARGAARVVLATDNSTGQPVLAVIFANSSWDESVGITQVGELPTLASTSRGQNDNAT